MTPSSCSAKTAVSIIESVICRQMFSEAELDGMSKVCGKVGGILSHLLIDRVGGVSILEIDCANLWRIVPSKSLLSHLLRVNLL